MKKTNLILVAFIAPVGSGKTYIAGKLAKKIGAIHVRTDDIRVALREEGKNYSHAPRMAKEKIRTVLGNGVSAIADFDAVLPKRRKELYNLAKKYNARCVFIQIKTPEKIILERLKKHRYTKKDLFQSAKEAISVYFIRKKLHKNLNIKPDFVIDNGKPLAFQIKNIVRKIKGL